MHFSFVVTLMNISQIRYFIAVYEEGSFSRAAKSLFVTVQATSKAIADLEKELGAPLFERKSRGVVPTPLGLSFYRKAVATLHSFEELEEFSHNAKAPLPRKTVKLALCSPEFRDYSRALKNIEDYISESLGIATNVVLVDEGDSFDLLRSGNVDALISIGQFDLPGMDCVPVLQAPTGVGFSVGHPLAARESIRIADLAPYPVYTSEKHRRFIDLILDMYRKRGLESPAESVASPEDSARFFSPEHGGYVFCVGLATLSDPRKGTIVRPIAPEDAVPVPVCLISPKEHKTPLYLSIERFLVNGGELEL